MALLWSLLASLSQLGLVRNRSGEGGRLSWLRGWGPVLTLTSPLFSEGVFKCPEDQLPLDYAKVSPNCQAEAQA